MAPGPLDLTDIPPTGPVKPDSVCEWSKPNISAPAVIPWPMGLKGKIGGRGGSLIPTACSGEKISNYLAPPLSSKDVMLRLRELKEIKSLQVWLVHVSELLQVLLSD